MARKATPDEAAKIDPADLVGATEIAAKLGVDRKTVHGWRNRPSRVPFPPPVATIERTLVFDWKAVEAWARATGRLGDG